MNSNEQVSIHQQVLKAIKQGSISMRPRWQFVLRGILAVVGGILIALVLLYLISLIIFMSRQTGTALVPAFGIRGVFAFVRTLPWLLIVLSIVFILVLEILVRRYSFAYRRPLVYSATGIIVLVVAGGFVVASTSFHRGLLHRAEQHRLPFAESFYNGIYQQEYFDIHRGLITATTTGGFLLRNPRNGTFLIMVTPDTKITPGFILTPGQTVVVFGDSASDTISALGIRQLPQ